MVGTSTTSTSNSVVDAWFEFALGFWGGKFTNQFASAEAIEKAKSTWADTFDKHRVSLLDVERARLFVQAEAVAWPLDCAGFLKACEPNPVDYGFLSVDKIWTQLINPYADHDWRKIDLLGYMIAHGKDESLHHAEIVSAGRCAPDGKRYQSKYHAVKKVYLWYVRQAINGVKFRDVRPEPMARLGLVSDDKKEKNLEHIARLRERFSFLKQAG